MQVFFIAFNHFQHLFVSMNNAWAVSRQTLLSAALTVGYFALQQIVRLWVSRNHSPISFIIFLWLENCAKVEEYDYETKDDCNMALRTSRNLRAGITWITRYKSCIVGLRHTTYKTLCKFLFYFLICARFIYIYI